jgi:hypothetical protein
MFLERLKETTKNVRIADIQTHIRTEHLPNKSIYQFGPRFSWDGQNPFPTFKVNVKRKILAKLSGL